MRVVLEALHELLGVFVDVGVNTNKFDPFRELVLGWQLAIEKEIGGLEVGAPLGELLDGISAIFEDAAVAVDLGDGRAAGRGVREGGVVDHEAEIVFAGLDLAEVHRLDGAVGDGYLVALSRTIVRYDERLAGSVCRHTCTFWLGE